MTKELTLRQRIHNSLQNLETELEQAKEKYHQLMGRKQAFLDLLSTAEALGHNLDSPPDTDPAAAPAAISPPEPPAPSPQ